MTDIGAQSPVRARLAMLCALMVLLVTGAMGGPGTGAATAATARNNTCYYFDFDGTLFHNYDYLGENAYCNNVDWATSLVFYDWADIDFVKSITDNLGYRDGSTDGMHMPVRTFGESTTWDRDAGKKEILCPVTNVTSRHYRIYAPSNYDYMYSISWGYYVVGSTHRDANECPPIGKRHFGSEEVEQHIAGRMEGAGYFVTRDWADFLNWEPYRVEGNHTWENNGFATFIQTPYPG